MDWAAEAEEEAPKKELIEPKVSVEKMMPASETMPNSLQCCTESLRRILLHTLYKQYSKAVMLKEVFAKGFFCAEVTLFYVCFNH